MSLNITNVLIGVGVGFVAAVGFAALYLMLNGNPNIIIPWAKKGGCTSNPECTAEKPVCADCVKCHDTLNKCVYALQETAGCLCVAGERKPCDTLTLGQMTCVAVPGVPNTTTWSDCDLFP